MQREFFLVELSKVKTFANIIKIKLQANDNKWPHEVALIQRLHTDGLHHNNNSNTLKYP